MRFLSFLSDSISLEMTDLIHTFEWELSCGSCQRVPHFPTEDKRKMETSFQIINLNYHSWSCGSLPIMMSSQVLSGKYFQAFFTINLCLASLFNRQWPQTQSAQANERINVCNVWFFHNLQKEDPFFVFTRVWCIGLFLNDTAFCLCVLLLLLFFLYVLRVFILHHSTFCATSLHLQPRLKPTLRHLL